MPKNKGKGNFVVQNMFSEWISPEFQLKMVVFQFRFCAGGKNRRRGKNENESEKRELIFKEDEQEYAQVTKMLGNGRLEAMCFDGQKRLCHIRGKMRKKVGHHRQWP